MTAWTEAQKAAISAVGRKVLVTASAGTGKTAVLAERAVRRISDSLAPVHADAMLVLTFTDAAAEEMRSRIAEALYKTYRQTAAKNLRLELLRLDRAYISTIHAFCKRILLEFFFLIDLDPAFGIVDEDEQRLVKHEVLTEMLEEAWADEQLAQAMRTLFDGRRVQAGSRSFIDRIIPLSEFLDSVVSRDDFYRRAAEISDIHSQAYRQLQDTQKEILLQELAFCRQKLSAATALDSQWCNGQYVSDYIQQTVLPAVLKCEQLIGQEKYEECRQYIAGINKWGQLRKKDKINQSQQELIKDLIKAVKDQLMALCDFALLADGYSQWIAPQAGLQTQTLLELLKRFDRCYRAVKQRRNVLDFADLEHRALALLESHPDVSAQLRKRFEHIFIDEYQDINAVQQRLIEHLARPDNLFVVGDIKQSIYGFRQSRPEIFLSHLESAADIAQPSSQPGRVDLQDNFRCRPEIISCVNALFERVMKTSVAGMDYDHRAHLRAAFPYEPFRSSAGPAHPVELYLLDREENGQADSDDTSDSDADFSQTLSEVQRQAAFIARRIRQMVGSQPEFSIFDKRLNAYRPAAYRDIVILLRSPAGRAQQYVEILRLAGVPVSSQSSCGFFETTEITDCLCLLKVLDNPCRDIELAALLRSPLFGLTDAQLALIRLHAEKKMSFYTALRKYAADGADAALRSTLSAILEQISDWRRQVRQGSLADLLDGIMRSKGLETFYAAMPNGAQRIANLQKLHDYAVRFEHFRTTEPGTALVRFVEFLEKLAEAEQDWAPAEPDSSAENVVRIMSIHKAKGLEFPVVFVAELNAKFNMQDTAGECLIDEQMLGLQIPVRPAAGRFPSMAHQVIAEQKRRSGLAEEMRILYVALTRAREKLILTASAKSDACTCQLSECSVFDSLPDWKLAEACCPLDWITAGFARQRALASLYYIDHPRLADDNLFYAQRIRRKDLNQMTEEILQAKRSVPSLCRPPKAGSEADRQAAAAFEAIGRNLRWRYPFEDLTCLPAKLSVSQLSHRDDEFAAGGMQEAFLNKPAGQPAAAAPGGAVLGSAVHRILEHIDMSKPLDVAAVKTTAESLCRAGLLDPSAADAIDPAAICAFFSSRLGMLARAAGAALLREWPFTYALDAAAVGAQSQGEFVILQGIIDMIIPVAEGLVIVDFKTDRIEQMHLSDRAARYAPQVRLYAQAAEAILKRPVVSAWLYFLTPATAVPVELNTAEPLRENPSA